MKHIVRVALPGIAMVAAGCASVTIKHEIPPIYATVDVNIRIQRQLEEVFDFEKPRTNPVDPEASEPAGNKEEKP